LATGSKVHPVQVWSAGIQGGRWPRTILLGRCLSHGVKTITAFCSSKQPHRRYVLLGL